MKLHAVASVIMKMSVGVEGRHLGFNPRQSLRTVDSMTCEPEAVHLEHLPMTLRLKALSVFQRSHRPGRPIPNRDERDRRVVECAPGPDTIPSRKGTERIRDFLLAGSLLARQSAGSDLPMEFCEYLVGEVEEMGYGAFSHFVDLRNLDDTVALFLEACTWLRERGVADRRSVYRQLGRIGGGTPIDRFRWSYSRTSPDGSTWMANPERSRALVQHESRTWSPGTLHAGPENCGQCVRKSAFTAS